MIKPGKVTDLYYERLRTITEALNALSPHFSVEIKRDKMNDSRGEEYKEVDYFVDCYLREFYKNSPIIKINIT